MSAITSATILVGEKRSRSIRRELASIFDRSRMSLMISSKCSPFRLMVSSALALAGGAVSIPSSINNRSAKPRMAVIGVRISWLMLARNSLFDWLACSARRRATSSSAAWAIRAADCCSICRLDSSISAAERLSSASKVLRSVMSVNVPAIRKARPCGSLMERARSRNQRQAPDFARKRVSTSSALLRSRWARMVASVPTASSEGKCVSSASSVFSNSRSA